ncbi:MAG: carbamoyltransferase HypF [Armatimonadetes bacterium]|nr:carbamoyltransferase HypF [Armatimonadota bacterium]
MEPPLIRYRAQVSGSVQGVGFRPFVYGLALQLGISGWVSNTPLGAEVQAQGEREWVTSFFEKIKSEIPFPARITAMEFTEMPTEDSSGFSIRESRTSGSIRATVLPDIATCSACLTELRDPTDRRYLYPFINCTHCGPRYSIIKQLPYDRPGTSMAGFPLCPDCLREYQDPTDRRFHAQPIACPRCGPHLELWEPDGRVIAERYQALERAAMALQSGEIVAVKGIGGFHLMVDARNDVAVRRLRERKKRESKPLAVMVPSLEWVSHHYELSDAEWKLLASPEAPIVIVNGSGSLAESVAPDSSMVGLLAPYSPLHWLLMDILGFPVVATSGNLSDEPICTDEREAVQRFDGIADLLLVHNRPIVRPIDDSVARVMDGEPVIWRRARGYAPMPVPLAGIEAGVLAVGGHLKNSVALSLDGMAVVGQHVGDLDTQPARMRMVEESHDLAALYHLEPKTVIHDLHPDYASTLFAKAKQWPTKSVQHHIAHAASCLAENEVDSRSMIVVWDGTGLGTDGTIWGGEFFAFEDGQIQRIAHLRPFPLVGGDVAVREPRRSALGVLFEAFGEVPIEFADWLGSAFELKGSKALLSLLRSGTSSVMTSSAGRLFDAFASLGAKFHVSRFEGDAPMRFESLAKGEVQTMGYPFPIRQENGLHILDWEPALQQLRTALTTVTSPSEISGMFHCGLANAIGQLAVDLHFERVGLSGGCFQNSLLFESTCQALRSHKIQVFSHHGIPPGDGGLAYGQLAASKFGWTMGREVR